MSPLLSFLLMGGLATGAVLVFRWAELSAERVSLVGFGLRFPRGLPATDVEAFVGALSALLPPWWKRWYSSPTVWFEISATAQGISHRLLVSASYQHQVENALQ